MKYAYCASEQMKTKLAKSQKGGNSNTLFVSAEAEVKEYTDKNGTYLLNYPVKGEATFLKVSFDMENIDFSDGVECAGESFKVTSVAAGAFAKTIESSEANTNYNDKLQSVVFPECDSLLLDSKAIYYCKNLKSIVIKAKNVTVSYAGLFTNSDVKTTLDLSNVKNITTGTEANGWRGIAKIIISDESLLDSIVKPVVNGTVAVKVGDDVNQWVKEDDGWRKTFVSGEVTDKKGVTWHYEDDGTGEGLTLTSYNDKDEHSDIVVPAYLDISGEKIPVTTLGAALFGTSDRHWDETDYINESIKSVIVPETVTCVKGDVFRRSPNLKTVVFRSSELTFDGARAFAGCSNLSQVDLSSVKELTIKESGKTIFNGSGAIVYISSKTVADTIERHVERANDHISYAITGGGILPAGTELEDKTLASPIKSGKKFAYWYKADDNKTAVTEAMNGNTYYAEWAGTNYSIKTDAKLGKVTYGYDDSEAVEASVTLRASGSDAEMITKATSSNAEYFDVEVDDNSITITPVTGLDAGEYHGTVYVTMEDNSVFFVEVTLTVEQAEPEYELPTGLKAIQGRTLADVEGLPEQFQWVELETVLKKYGLQTFKAVYTPTDTKNYLTVKCEIDVDVMPQALIMNHVPTINAKDLKLTVGDTFDAKKNVTASDAEDGDLTAKIEITANDVDTTKAGTYHVMYKITDSKGASATKTITVTVKAKANTNSSDSDDSDEPASSTTKKINLVSASTLEGFWKRNEKGWWFEAKDGSYPKSSWKLIGWNGKQQWYHFDENGYMQTGWIKDNGIWYYLHNQADGSQGHMYTGWHLIDGKWYYFSEGMKQPQGAMLANMTVL